MEPINRPPSLTFRSVSLQVFVVVLCVAFSLTMIMNNQLGGEAMWFWYATIFHQGAKLYSQLHIALQPLFVLETDAWMQLVGRKIMATETLSLLHILGLCLSIFLVLRDSTWDDWQRACVLFGAFCLTVCGNSYRFDDYHVLAEAFIFFGLAGLLRVARAETLRKQRTLVAALGLVCGLTIETRVTDGVALIAACVLILPFLVARNKVESIGILLLVAAATILSVVHMTGDTFHAYLYSSLIHAAGSKGGTASIFAAPLLTIWNALPILVFSYKKLMVGMLVVIATGPLVCRYWRAGVRFIYLLQLLVAGVLFLLFDHGQDRAYMLKGRLISMSVLFLMLVLYILPLVVLARWIKAKREGKPFDAREVLVLLPLAEWASYSAGAAAEPLTNYYAPIAMLLLLIPVLRPFRRYADWANPSVAMLLTLLALSSISGKIITPYSWQNYRYKPMFVNRVWYRHPVYGEMYIDKDLLNFSEMVCSDIGENPIGLGTGPGQPELLSLPYPFPNYFCDTPPWHNYVQTFFDTSTRATIEQLIQELKTAPPKYIVYQRQINIMQGAERLYNHKQPLAQRDLDTLIFEKMARREWTLLDKSDYLRGPEMGEPEDTGWFIIQTHP